MGRKNPATKAPAGKQASEASTKIASDDLDGKEELDAKQECEGARVKNPKNPKKPTPQDETPATPKKSKSKSKSKKKKAETEEESSILSPLIAAPKRAAPKTAADEDADEVEVASKKAKKAKKASGKKPDSKTVAPAPKTTPKKAVEKVAVMVEPNDDNTEDATKKNPKKKNGYLVVEEMLKEGRKKEAEAERRQEAEQQLERENACFLCPKSVKLASLLAHVEKAHRKRIERPADASAPGSFVVQWPYKWGGNDHMDCEGDGTDSEDEKEENKSPVLVRFDGQIFTLSFECEDDKGKFSSWVSVVGDKGLAKGYAAQVKYVNRKHEIRHLSEEVFAVHEDSEWLERSGRILKGNPGWIPGEVSVERGSGDDEEEDEKENRPRKHGMLDFEYKIWKH